MQSILNNNKSLVVSAVIVLIGCCIAGLGTLAGGTQSIALPGFLTAIFG